MNLQEGYTSNFLRLRHLKMNLSTKTTKVEKKIRKTKKKKLKQPIIQDCCIIIKQILSGRASMKEIKKQNQIKIKNKIKSSLPRNQS